MYTPIESPVLWNWHRWARQSDRALKKTLMLSGDRLRIRVQSYATVLNPASGWSSLGWNLAVTADYFSHLAVVTQEQSRMYYGMWQLKLRVRY